MISRAKLKYLRIAPRKVRLVTDLLRGEKVERAQVILDFTRKKAAFPILKLLKQAIANTRNKLEVDEKNLYISEILVDEGPKLKRYLPRARGRADVIHKKTSHITIVLDEIEKKAKKKIKKKAVVKKKKLKVEKVEKEEEREEEIIKKETKIIEKKKGIEKLKAKTGRGMKFFRRKAF